MRLIPRLNSTVWLFGRHWNRRMFCVQERDAVRVTASRMQPQHSQSAYKCAWLCVATRFRSSPSNRSTCHCIPHSKWIARLSRETATTTTTTKNPRAVCKSHYSACTTTRIMGIYNIRIMWRLCVHGNSSKSIRALELVFFSFYFCYSHLVLFDANHLNRMLVDGTSPIHFLLYFLFSCASYLAHVITTTKNRFIDI